MAERPQDRDGKITAVGHVIVVGSLNVDRPWRVDRHPIVGETVLGEMRPLVPGGKGLNQAVAARRVGARTRLVGCVGADDDGRWLVRLVEDEGVDTGGVLVDATLRTGTALIVVADDGANTVTVDPGANTALRVDDLSVGPGDVVVAQLEVPVDAVAGAFTAARAAGATTVLNPSPIGPGRALVPLADVVVVNQHEAAELSGADALAVTAAEALTQARTIADGQRIVVVTLGPEGAVAFGPDVEVVLAGVEVTPVDTVGAGDCFLGVLAAGLASGDDLGVSLERANRAAAIAVTRPGAADAMPTVADLANPSS